MDLGLANKNALVCASTAGLGAATARALAMEGANVVFSGRRADLAEECAAPFEGSVGLHADLSSVEGARALYDSAVEAIGQIDILVLNGPGPRPGTATTLNTDDILTAFTTLVLVHEELVRASLPHMVESKWGRILAVGSGGVAAPITGLALSNIGRSSLAAYLKSLSNEVASSGVNVNMLLPGRIATDRLTSLDTAAAEAQGTSVDEIARKGQSIIPQGRYGRPEEFGAVAAFLCSEPASYVNGIAMRCDGGVVPFM